MALMAASGRPRSLRTRVLLALGLTLAAASLVSMLVDRQITSTRVRAESQQLLANDLDVAARSLADDRGRLMTSLRFNAQSLQVDGVSQTTGPVDLQRMAGEVQRNLGVDGVLFASEEGTVLAEAGAAPASGSIGALTQGSAAVPRYVTGREGQVLEVLSVRVADGLWLTMVVAVDDARAFALRRLIGRDVVLLHDGAVVGSTIDERSLVRDALGDAAQEGMVDAIEIMRPEGTSLVGFAPVGADTWVAVVTPRLLEDLERSLTSAGVATFLAVLLVALVVGYAYLRRLTRPLTRLAETAEAVRRGDAGERFPTGGRDEIGELATTLENMRATLQEQVGIISRQSEELQGASQRIATVRDVERRRLARDLHDGVQQQLVMLRLRVRLLDGDVTPEELAEIGRSVEAVIEQLRETSQAIYPSILADRGLTGALYSLAATSPLPIDLALAPDPLPRFAEPVEGGVYFMVAEAITNCVKHADAQEVRVTVEVAGALLTLLVCDDGVGFEPAVRTRGSGVQNLRDRAAALGGLAGIRSEPGVGTAVAVVVPLGPESVVGALEEEQHRRDTPVEVVGVAQAQLLEDGVGVLLDRAFADDECVGDG